jgi:hypothetical protein
MDTLTSLEQAVLEKLLSGESEGYRILQKQIPALRVTERKMTGVGFFSHFSLPDEAPKLPDEASLEIGDVGADLTDLRRDYLLSRKLQSMARESLTSAWFTSTI